MSLLQEMQKYGLADCAFNRQLINGKPLFIVAYRDKSGEECSIHFATLRRAEEFARRYRGMIIQDGEIVREHV